MGRSSRRRSFAAETFCADDPVQRWHYSFASGHVRGADLFCVRDGEVAERLSYVKGRVLWRVPQSDRGAATS